MLRQAQHEEENGGLETDLQTKTFILILILILILSLSKDEDAPLSVRRIPRLRGEHGGGLKLATRPATPRSGH